MVCGLPSYPVMSLLLEQGRAHLWILAYAVSMLTVVVDVADRWMISNPGVVRKKADVLRSNHGRIGVDRKSW